MSKTTRSVLAIGRLYKKFFSYALIVIFIASWLFADWPPIWHNPRIPPKIQIAEAVTETFTSTTTWTAPTGVTSVTAEVWGGGGGGGGMNQSSDGGGGGGGGAYSIKAGIVVVPGTGYTVTVGGAGTGNAGCTASTAGGDSWFSTSGTVLAKGGSPGACSTGSPPAGGAGGAAASGVGDTKFSGGTGGRGRDNATGRGAPGGSSAGTAANGTNGPDPWTTATASAAQEGGGIGGDGGNANGAAGAAPASGNGGGGGGAAEGTNIAGGAGAVGKVILTYNKPPNAPSQDAPANSATDVSVTPTFTMTATDDDADKLGYKVTIFSNSGCTTIVQDNDQATSTPGWTGTNATCTAAPTSCYTSGTQGSFLTQTALSNSTQYWWKAKAKDPDGNGKVTDSSTCNTFTTVSAGSLSLTASSSQSFDAAIIVQFTSQTSTMSSTGAIKVADTRGGSPGWTLVMTGADWKSGQDVMQLDYDGTGSDGNLGKLCPKPNTGTLYAESGSLVGVSKGTNQCFSSGVTSITALSATSGNGTGTYWLTDMPAEQFFPGSPTVASYTTTIVFTLSMREKSPRSLY